MELTATSAITS